MVRLAIILLTRRWGLIVIGLLLVIGGLIYGLTSHSVSYTTVNRATIAHILSGDGTGYLQLQRDPQLYIIHQSDFTPKVDDSTLSDGDVISFVYRPDQTKSIDESATNTDAHLQGNAFTVEQITGADPNNGVRTYSTSEYSQNPKGFYDNNWLPGGLLLLAGLVIGGAAFVVPMLRKPKTAYGISTPGMEVGGMSGTQGQPGPYQQPYQDLGQYNQPYADTGTPYSNQAPQE